MKKKKAKRNLHLAKQTIRRLGEDQLDGAIGGAVTQSNVTYVKPPIPTIQCTTP